MIKQIEPNRVSLCGVDFAIYPFGAMKAANLSGELGKFLGPIVAGCLPLIGSNDDDVLSMDLKDAMPLITGAFSMEIQSKNFSESCCCSRISLVVIQILQPDNRYRHGLHRMFWIRFSARTLMICIDWHMRLLM